MIIIDNIPRINNTLTWIYNLLVFIRTYKDSIVFDISYLLATSKDPQTV